MGSEMCIRDRMRKMPASNYLEKMDPRNCGTSKKMYSRDTLHMEGGSTGRPPLSMSRQDLEEKDIRRQPILATGSRLGPQSTDSKARGTRTEYGTSQIGNWRAQGNAGR